MKCADKKKCGVDSDCISDYCKDKKCASMYEISFRINHCSIFHSVFSYFLPSALFTLSNCSNRDCAADILNSGVFCDFWYNSNYIDEVCRIIILVLHQFLSNLFTFLFILSAISSTHTKPYLHNYTSIWSNHSHFLIIESEKTTKTTTMTITTTTETTTTTPEPTTTTTETTTTTTPEPTTTTTETTTVEVAACKLGN